MSGSESQKTNRPKSVGRDSLEVFNNKPSRVQKQRDGDELHKERIQKGKEHSSSAGE